MGHPLRQFWPCHLQRHSWAQSATRTGAGEEAHTGRLYAAVTVTHMQRAQHARRSSPHRRGSERLWAMPGQPHEQPTVRLRSLDEQHGAMASPCSATAPPARLSGRHQALDTCCPAAGTSGGRADAAGEEFGVEIATSRAHATRTARDSASLQCTLRVLGDFAKERGVTPPPVLPNEPYCRRPRRGFLNLTDTRSPPRWLYAPLG